MILADINESSLREMDQLVEQGVTSFKMFVAYPGVFYSTDGQILAAMQRAAGNGALIQMHAENGIAIDRLVAEALARGFLTSQRRKICSPSRIRPASIADNGTYRTVERIEGSAEADSLPSAGRDVMGDPQGMRDGGRRGDPTLMRIVELIPAYDHLATYRTDWPTTSSFIYSAALPPGA